MAAFISALANIAGQGLSAFGVGNNPQEWLQNAIISVWNRAQQGDAEAQEMFRRFSDPLRQAAIQPTEVLGNLLSQGAPGLLESGQGLLGGMSDLFRGAQSQYLTPEMQQINQLLGGVAGGMGPMASLAGQGFAGGGWTPQYQQAFDWLSPFMAGRGSNAQMAMGELGPELLGQRGKTNLTMGLQDRALDAANTGGWNPWLTEAMQTALGTLRGGGYSPGASSLLGAGQNIFSQGGETPFTRGMQERGLELAGREPLISMEDAASFARDDAAQQMLQASEAAMRKAQARGGSAGAITGAGSRNEVMADFADEAARLQSQAVREAILGQQGLGLQQQGLGSGVFSAGASPATQRLGIGADLMGSGEQSAVNRMGQAFGAVPGTQSAATNFLDALMGAGLGAGQLETSRMGLGGELSNMFGQQQLGFGNLFNNTMGNQNQYALGLGNLFGNLSQTQGGLNNQMFNNLLGAGQLGVSGASGLADALNRAFGNYSGAYGNLGNVWGTALSPLTSLSNAALNYGSSWVNQMNPFRGSEPSMLPGNNWSSLSNIFQQIAGLIPRGGGGGKDLPV